MALGDIMPLYLWQRYFLKELIKSFIIILAAFYSLYIVIDYASHLSSWRHHGVHLSWQQSAFYYFCEFLHRADVLLPFALLVATLKTLLALNKNGELIALLSCGISLQRLLRPFLYCALALAFILYLNAEYGIPIALNQLKIKQGKGRISSSSVYEAPLSDGTRLLYSLYNAESGALEDVYWIKSGSLIIKMQKLWLEEKPPRAIFVETLQRGYGGAFTPIASAEEQIFPNMALADGQAMAASAAPELQALSTLLQQFSNNNGGATYRGAQLITAFYQRLSMPWLSLLAIMISAPYCMQYSRYSSNLAIYAGAIFGLVACYLFLDALIVLGRRQIIDPAWAIFLPLSAISLWAFYNFIRLRL